MRTTTKVILAAAPLALAQTRTVVSVPEPTFAVSDYLSGIYGTAIPPAATGAAATSLVSALESFQSEHMTDSAYIEAASEIYMAAATASNSDAIFSSLMDQNQNAEYTTADWYVQGVPASAKSEWQEFFSSLQDVQSSVLGTVDTTATATAKSGDATVMSTVATGTGTGTGSSTTGSGNSHSASASGATASPSTAGAIGVRATGGAASGLVAVVAIGAIVLA